MPSILDGMPRSPADMKDVILSGASFLGTGIENGIIPANVQPFAAELAKGLSIADVAGITKEERNAFLLEGGRMLQAGDAAGAQQLLTYLLQLEPTDERTIYLLAAAFQAQGKYANAGKLYTHFLALDATNPDGYLRLGECFLANKEWDQAEGCFSMAKIVSDTPRADVTAFADRMLAVLKSQKAAAA